MATRTVESAAEFILQQVEIAQRNSRLTNNRMRSRRYSKRMKTWPTLTEEMLAKALKKRKYWFRTQVPKYDDSHLYLVDFLLDTTDGPLVIEVDGPIHNARSAYDASRTEWLKTNRKCMVLRFTNKEVFYELPRVLSTIAAYFPRKIA